MTKKLVGLFASVALLGSGMALANNEDKNKNQQTQSSGQLGGDATGGAGQSGQSGQMGGSSGQSGQMGSSGQSGQMGASGQSGQMGSAQQMGQKQVSGTVVKSSASMLHLRTDNGIIPLKVGRDVKIDDPNVKRVRDLKEGQQVRASFDIQGTDNVAKSISLDTNMGGSGMGGDTGINQQPSDTGGSGLDQDINKDLGGDVGGSGDVGGDVGGSGDMSGHKGDKSY
jgi:hypothetical protein